MDAKKPPVAAPAQAPPPPPPPPAQRVETSKLSAAAAPWAPPLRDITNAEPASNVPPTAAAPNGALKQTAAAAAPIAPLAHTPAVDAPTQPMEFTPVAATTATATSAAAAVTAPLVRDVTTEETGAMMAELFNSAAVTDHFLATNYPRALRTVKAAEILLTTVSKTSNKPPVDLPPAMSTVEIPPAATARAPIAAAIVDLPPPSNVQDPGDVFGDDREPSASATTAETTASSSTTKKRPLDAPVDAKTNGSKRPRRHPE